MNIPIKVLKSNSIANEKVRNQQKVAQKYYNSVTSNAKLNTNLNESQKSLINEKNNSQNQIKNIHNIFSISNLKEEIIRWFFSIGLNQKMVLSSIENKWLVNCIHFMYIKLKNEPYTKFSYLDGEAPECGIENFHHKASKQPIIFTNKKMTNNLFFHFFSTIEDSNSKKNSYSSYGLNTISINSNSSSLLNSSNNNNYNNNNNFNSINCNIGINNNYINNTNYNNYNSKENSEFDFLNDINFYKCEESDISNDYCSYISLAEKIIENEVYFLKIFDYYSKGKAFTNFIPAHLDSQSKYYTYGMPDWFFKKEAYSLQEILVAYFEQTITVKFVLFHLDPNNYNYYYTKYLKNSYIKKLKEESDPAIYNENAESNSNNNNLNVNNNNNLSKNNNKNEKKFINNNEAFEKNENLSSNNSNSSILKNCKNSNAYSSSNNNIINNNNNNNFQLNGEYSYHYNYNSTLDSSPKNNESKTLNHYFYNLLDPSESSLSSSFNSFSENNNNKILRIKDDFEKNLGAAAVASNSCQNQSKSPNTKQTNNNSNNQSKSYSFIKSMHNVRIHLEKERSYPKGVYEIPEFDCYLKKILKEKSEITSLFYSEIKSMEKLYLQSKGDKLMEEIWDNKDLKEFLVKKSFNQQDFIPFNRHSKLLKKVSFSEKKDFPFDIDLKFFITTQQNFEELLKKIIFLDIHQIFTFDDIILKRLFDNIYSIYTYKSLLDLIAEEDKDGEFVEKLNNNSNVNANGSNNCKKKKKRKNTKKSVEKNENLEKNLNNNNLNSLNSLNNDSDKIGIEKNFKNESRITCGNNYNNNNDVEKNSLNNLDNIEDIKINLNDNITENTNADNNICESNDKNKISNEKEENLLIKTKNYNKDKTIYNNYIKISEDVYNNKTENLLDTKLKFSENSNNNNIKINNKNVNINENSVEHKEIINRRNEKKTSEKNKNDKTSLKTQDSELLSDQKEINKKIEINCAKNSCNNNIIQYSKQSKKKNENDSNSKAILNPLEMKKSNNNNKIENKQRPIDHKRPNSNSELNNCKKNIKSNCDCSNNLKEEKKEFENQKDKVTNYKQMNLKDILTLEFIPKKKTEAVKPNNNQTHPYKINSTKIITNNVNYNENNRINNFNKNLILKTKAETSLSNKEENIAELKLSSENEKDSVSKLPITTENMQLNYNLNMLNQNCLGPRNSTINVSDLVNISNESDSLKNENSQDKNENDTDTAYSSSNQSETNNFQPENIEIPSMQDNSINAFEVNRINNNNNNNLHSNSNLIYLKNNLRNNHNTRKTNDNVNGSKSGLTDVKNINNYLISPKKNHENCNLININLDSEFKNIYGKNKELDLIDINEKINFSTHEKVNNSNKDSGLFKASKNNNNNNLKVKEIKDNQENRINENIYNDKNFKNKELESQAIASNKIHFSLNPLANIYKLSNKNTNKENKSQEKINESKPLNQDLAADNLINTNNFNTEDSKITNKNYNNEAGFNQDSYFNYNSHKGCCKNNYSNYNLNSPNSIKSDKPFYNNNNSKNDLYSAFYGHSASFEKIAYNPLYATGINPLANTYGINSSKSFFGGFNSPNYLKSKEFSFYQNYEKKNNNNAFYNISTNKTENDCDSNSNTEAYNKNNLTEKTQEKEKDKESIEAQNLNSFSESNKKIKNKLKKNSANLNISKDDLNLVKAKALNFSESSSLASQAQGNSLINNNNININKKQKISKLINPSLNGNYSIGNSTTINNNSTSNNNNSKNNNIPVYSNSNLNLIAQAPVYQNYIPKNVNFRNFNFPVDLNNNYNIGYNAHSFSNYNFFYPINLNNMGFMGLNVFGTSANAPTTSSNYYESSFYRKLHSDILEYNQKLEKNIALTKEIKSNVVLYLTQKIKEILDFLNIEVNIYGSFANDLSIECSDIDLIVKYEIKQDCDNPNFQGIQNYAILDIEFIISYLTNAFNEVKCMEKVNPIYTASVPIIKLIIDPGKIGDITLKKACSYNHLEISKDLKLNLSQNEDHKYTEKNNNNNNDDECEIINKSNSVEDFEINNLNESEPNYEQLKKNNLEKIAELKNSEIYNSYCFNTEELEKVKIDITFAEINSRNNSNAKDQTQMAVEFTKNNNKKFPEIGYIIKIIKRLLQIENLNNSFNGGLSSFTLFLLVLAFTKNFRNKSFLNNYYGLFLVEFFNFYANFDFQNYYIDVNLDMPFIAITEITENIPLIKNPFNSYLNAAKSSYRINELKELFATISERLNTIRNSFNSNNTENFIFSIIFKK